MSRGPVVIDSVLTSPRRRSAIGTESILAGHPSVARSWIAMGLFLCFHKGTETQSRVPSYRLPCAPKFWAPRLRQQQSNAPGTGPHCVRWRRALSRDWCQARRCQGWTQSVLHFAPTAASLSRASHKNCAPACLAQRQPAPRSRIPLSHPPSAMSSSTSTRRGTPTTSPSSASGHAQNRSWACLSTSSRRIRNGSKRAEI